ncbi:MAG: magnesium/cobalt transporter CorA [Alicyclobacillus sp.]|nr:magnesium/cobalt transporter CorA [Alicyclobacillus sp.]
MVYREGQVQETQVRPPAPGEVVWIHLRDPDEETAQHVLQQQFDCHPLVVEDILHFGQRPKVDHYLHVERPQALISFYALHTDLTPLEFCLVLGHDFVITVERSPVAELAEVRQRVLAQPDLLASPGRFAYALLDLCVDHYADVVARLEDRLDSLERHVFDRPQSPVAGLIFRMKRQVGRVRRLVADGRNVVGALAHESFPFTTERESVYFVDVYDHATRVVDALDAIRDNLSGLLDLQTAQRANRLNEVMKTLTVISTIFLPLNFIVGLYGMNFQDIPELHWRYGYLYVWSLMLAVASGMMVYFKRRGWW